MSGGPAKGASKHVAGCTCVRCRGFEAENALATKHGAYSPNRIKQRARAHRRRFLRQAGLRASDLDAIAAGYLEGWARALAKLDLFDDAGLEREPREYFTAMNSARLWLTKLEGRLRDLGIRVDRQARRGDALRAHLREQYGREGGYRGGGR